MSTMLSEVYDAFKEAGVSDEKARKAAEAMASYDKQFGEVDTKFAHVMGEFSVVKWMLGFNLALTIAVLGRLILK